MSELKAFNCVESDLQEFCEPRLVYLKDDADKVIAELKSDIADLRDDKKTTDAILNERNEEIAELNKQIEFLKDKLRHQNYKRCLAMARIVQDDWHLHNSFYAMGHREFEKRKCEFYEKWHKRWLDIAEQFKPNSTLNKKD